MRLFLRKCPLLDCLGWGLLPCIPCELCRLSFDTSVCLIPLQLVTAWKPRDFHTNSALLKVNEAKNRDAKLVPGKNNRNEVNLEL